MIVHSHNQKSAIQYHRGTLALLAQTKKDSLFAQNEKMVGGIVY